MSQSILLPICKFIPQTSLYPEHLESEKHRPTQYWLGNEGLLGYLKLNDFELDLF